MKLTSSVYAAIQTAVFLVGSAWLGGGFHVEELPKFEPEVHATIKAALHIDDGPDDPPQIVLEGRGAMLEGHAYATSSAWGSLTTGPRAT
jgi:hypothetical protein